MEEDDSVYNAIIIALAIGIVIVIATLIIARPRPETFTEIYFEDHKDLPKFVELQKPYPLSFTIANHENSSRTYNYTLTEEFYNIDYSCDTPQLYFDNNTATSTEPSYLIKDDNYSITFDTNFRSGNELALRFLDIYGKEKYSFNIDLAKKEASFNSLVSALNVSDDNKHRFELKATPDSLILNIDGNSAFNLKGPTAEKAAILEYTSPIDIEKFTEQLNYLKDNGYTLSGFEDLENLPKRAVIITFDDATKDILNISQLMGQDKAVLGLNTKRLYSPVRNYLNINELKGLRSKGWEIVPISSNLLSMQADTRAAQLAIMKKDIQSYLDYTPLGMILAKQNSTIKEECQSVFDFCTSPSFAAATPKYISSGDLPRIIISKSTTLQQFANIFPGEEKDYQLLGKLPGWNTKGFFSFESNNTFVDITNVEITRSNQKQKKFNIANADSKYLTQSLNLSVSLTTNESILDVMTNKETPKIVAEIKGEKPENLTSYSAEFQFRITKGDEISFVTDSLELFYNEKTKEVYAQNSTHFKVAVPKPNKAHRIEVIMENNSAVIYFDAKRLGTIDNIKNNNDPSVRMINSEAQVSSIVIKSNTEPLTIDYKLPTNIEQQTKYTTFLSPQIMQTVRNVSNNNTDNKEYIQDFYNYQAVTWQKYTITAQYTNTNGTLFLSFGDFEKDDYSISITNNTAFITYLQGNVSLNTTVLIPNSSSRKVVISADKSYLSISIDNNEIFTDNFDNPAEGLFLIDSAGISVQTMQIENPETGEVRAQRIKTAECTPMIIKHFVVPSSSYIPIGESKTFNSSIIFKDDFDIGKIQLELSSGEEIHYWVTKI